MPETSRDIRRIIKKEKKEKISLEPISVGLLPFIPYFMPDGTLHYTYYRIALVG